MFVTSVWGQHYPILAIPGSPHDITALFEDSRSAIWIGTIDDAILFDGNHFYSLRPYGFPREHVESLAEDGDGGIWIGTSGSDLSVATARGGLYRYTHGRVEKVLTGDVPSVVSDKSGVVLASVGDGTASQNRYNDLYLFRKSGQSWIPTMILPHSTLSITTDLQGSALFPCPGGFCELSLRQLSDWPEAGTKPAFSNLLGGDQPTRILRDGFGCVWFRSELATKYKCPNDNEVWKVPDAFSGIDAGEYLQEASDGTILLDNGIVRGRPGSFKVLSALKVLESAPGVKIGLLAKDGTLFLGGNEIYRVMYPFRLEYWDKRDGTLGGFSVLRSGDRVFCAFDGISVLSADRQRWSKLSDADTLRGTVHIALGPKNTLLAASVTKGLNQLTVDGKILVTLPMSNAGAARLAEGSNGEFWLSGRSLGISRVDVRDKRLLLDSAARLSGRSVDLTFDRPRNTLWGCFNNEVVAQRNGAWLHIGHSDGLIDSDCRSVAVLPNGDVWVGYGRSAAFSRIRGAYSGKMEIKNFVTGGQIENAQVEFLDTDTRGWLWRASESKDYLSTPESAENGRWLTLGKEDGIPTPGANQNSFYSDPDGSVWIPSNGIVHFNPPDGFATNFPSPPVFISGLAVDSAAPVLADLVASVPHGRPITVEIGVTQFDRRSAIRLRYRLLPGDREWHETDSLDLPLGKLSIGRHTLEVQGSLFTGDWSQTARSTFTVLWPVWLTWPALLCYGAGGTGVGVGASAWRKRRRLRRSLVLPDITSWRMGALSPETEHLIGTTVDGRYEIGHILSIGGFATVARARDKRKDGQLCAIKIFRPGLADEEWIRHRFEQEVAALEQLSHPNIVRITGRGSVDAGAPYLVMEFIHGVSLRDLLLEEGVLSRQETGNFLEQMASALSALHERSIYHRDLKPENLMVRSGDDGTRQIILIDFSIALVKTPEKTFHGISRVAGSLDYMAPEQLTGYADSSTDIHSLAKVVIEMLSGTRWSELLEWATLDMPGQARAYFTRSPHGLSAESVEMLASALAFDPGRRPKEVAEFAKGIVHDLGAVS